MYTKRKIMVILCLLLTLGLITSIGYNINLFTKNEQLTEKVRTLTRKLNSTTPIIKLINSTLEKPETRWTTGYKIASGSRLSQDGRLTVAIFNIHRNATLELTFSMRPREGYYQKLVIQDGNAYNNESGVLVGWYLQYTYIGITQIPHNITQWQTPVIWEVNARDGETYSAELGEGWYTLTMGGPLLYSTGYLGGGGGLNRENSTLPWPETSDSYVEFKIVKEGKILPFIMDLWN